MIMVYECRYGRAHTWDMQTTPAPLEPAAAVPAARRELELLEQTVESLADQTRAINSAHATTPSGQNYSTQPDVITNAWLDDRPATAVA